MRTFKKFIGDFSLCLTALSGVTNPFGNWWNGFSFVISNIRMQAYNEVLPFYVFSTRKKTVYIIHVPYMKRSAGKLLVKLLDGLGYAVSENIWVENNQDMISKSLTKKKDFSIVLDEFLLEEES